MLGFVEEIVSLQLDEGSGTFADLPEAVSEVVIGGAALMELAIKNRIDTDLESLTVLDASPTGDGILDDILLRLSAADGNLTAAAALELVTPNSRQYQEEALRRLVAKGILRERDGRFLWVFQTRRYPVIDNREQREVRARLRQLLLTDEIPDPNDVVLICLIDACGLLRLVLASEEAPTAMPRVAQLAKLDLIGQAVTNAVREIQFIVRHAAAANY
jgi:hypothetical protein